MSGESVDAAAAIPSINRYRFDLHSLYFMCITGRDMPSFFTASTGGRSSPPYPGFGNHKPITAFIRSLGKLSLELRSERELSPFVGGKFEQPRIGYPVPSTKDVTLFGEREFVPRISR